jgi:tetratricopeptide (TPR) repeat protein
MQRSKLVHDLIHSLSPPEKRYILKHLKLFREETNHADLFKAIDQLVEYDSDLLKKKLGNSGAAKHLDVAKVQLYDICLRHLRSFHENNNSEIRLKALLSECRLLIGRGMYEHCRRRLTQLKALAVKNFFFLVQIEINQIERELLMQSVGNLNLFEEIVRLDEEEKMASDLYANFRFYRQAANLAYVHSKVIGTTHHDSATKMLNELLSHELLIGEEKAISPPAKRLFYYVKAYEAKMASNTIKAIEYNRKQADILAELFQSIPELFQSLMSALYNLLIDYYIGGYYDEALDIILQLRMLPESSVIKTISSTVSRQKILIRVTNMELAVLTRMGRFEQESINWDEVSEALVMLDEGKDLFMGIELRYSAAHFCYGSGNYRQALRYINTLINDAPSELVMRMQYMAWLLRLVIYREISEDKASYNSLIRQTRNWMEEMNVEHELAFEILRFLENEMTSEHGSDVWKEHLSLLQAKHKSIPEHIYETYIFDSRSWLESIEGKGSYAELVQAKYKLRAHKSQL